MLLFCQCTNLYFSFSQGGLIDGAGVLVGVGVVYLF